MRWSLDIVSGANYATKPFRGTLVKASRICNVYNQRCVQYFVPTYFTITAIISSYTVTSIGIMTIKTGTAILTRIAQTFLSVWNNKYIDNVTNDIACLQKSPKGQTAPGTMYKWTRKHKIGYFEISAEQFLIRFFLNKALKSQILFI